MNRKTKHLRTIYAGLLVVFFALLVLGMVNVFSSTFVGDSISGGNTYAHVMRQFLAVAIGAIPTYFVYKKNYHWLDKRLKIWCVLTFFCLLLVWVIGIHVNGAKRWIGISFITFQPSELAKLVGILYTASCVTTMLKNGKPLELFHRLSNRRQAPFWQHIRLVPDISLWVPFVFAAMVAVQPDMGTALVIFAIPAMVVVLAGAKLRSAKAPVLLAVAAIAAYTLSAPYRMNRIISWIDPWSYEKTLGYQTVQGLIAIGSGGIFGQGLGTGVSKFSYLPEAHTDFAFAIFAQEWGLLGSFVMVALFMMIIYLGISCAHSTHDTYGTLLALGITLYLGGQGFINICMVSGILPVVGVPLPFISYGGSSLIVNMIAAGLLLNIARHNYKEAQRQDLAGEAVKPVSMKVETRSRFPLH